MLYLFAGTDRKTSVKAALGKFSLQFGKEFIIECEEWDICRDPAQDLLDEETQKRLLQRIRNREFVAVLLSPPCASWSRVRHLCDGLGKCSPGLRPAGHRIPPVSKKAADLRRWFWAEVEELEKGMRD